MITDIESAFTFIDSMRIKHAANIHTPETTATGRASREYSPCVTSVTTVNVRPMRKNQTEGIVALAAELLESSESFLYTLPGKAEESMYMQSRIIVVVIF